MEWEVTVDIDVDHDYGDMLEYIKRVKGEANLSQVVLVGIQAMQTAQRSLAPVGKDRRIPSSIKPARVTKQGQHTWSGVSRTTYGPAVFTNEGTGIHGPSKSTYQIVQHRQYTSGKNRGKPYEVNITHPGIRGTHWWEAGAELGSKIALEAFKRKIARMMRR